MQTERGLDRLTYFTDAIAAIAITLLILPIVDRVGEAAESGTSPVGFLGDNLPSLLAFVLSFLVIARLWMTHHGIFEHVRAYSHGLRWLSIAWAFTIVLLPLPTAMTAAWNADPLIIGFYGGTMLLSSGLLTATLVAVHGHRELENPDAPIDRAAIVSSAVMTGWFGLVVVLGVTVPRLNYWAFLLLLLAAPVSRFIRYRLRSRD